MRCDGESSVKGDGGEGEIRTHGGVAPTPVFKTGAFGHSATSPRCLFQCVDVLPFSGQNEILSISWLSVRTLACFFSHPPLKSLLLVIALTCIQTPFA